MKDNSFLIILKDTFTDLLTQGWIRTEHESSTLMVRPQKGLLMSQQRCPGYYDQVTEITFSLLPIQEQIQHLTSLGPLFEGCGDKVSLATFRMTKQTFLTLLLEVSLRILKKCTYLFEAIDTFQHLESHKCSLKSPIWAYDSCLGNLTKSTFTDDLFYRHTLLRNLPMACRWIQRGVFTDWFGGLWTVRPHRISGLGC